MAENQRLVSAAPDAVFDVLADPRGYAYWVVGSRKIRDADDSWPAQGSRFHHAVGLGPMCIRDHSQVEEMQPDRFLQLKVKFRPLGTARVKLELEPAGTGTRITMIEDPADTATAFLFTPLTHLLVRRRNVRSLDRLADLVEGRVPIPGDEPAARVRSLDGDGSVENPLARERLQEARRTGGALARGIAAGFVGGMAMTISTNVEMRLRGRPPSDSPARAMARVFGIKVRGKNRRQRLMLAGHLGTSIALGCARGALGRAGVRPGPAGAAVFGLALLPDAVVVPALGAADPPWEWSAADVAVTVLHHGVYAAATDAAYALLEART